MSNTLVSLALLSALLSGTDNVDRFSGTMRRTCGPQDGPAFAMELIQQNVKSPRVKISIDAGLPSQTLRQTKVFRFSELANTGSAEICRDGCKSAVSGTVVLNHFDGKIGTGNYVLKFVDGTVEKGEFRAKFIEEKIRCG